MLTERIIHDYENDGVFIDMTFYSNQSLGQYRKFFFIFRKIHLQSSDHTFVTLDEIQMLYMDYKAQFTF